MSNDFIISKYFVNRINEQLNEIRNKSDNDDLFQHINEIEYILKNALIIKTEDENEN